mgnify:CR=1 FL=1
MSRANRYGFVFLCCVLAIPTCVYGLGLLRADEPWVALLSVVAALAGAWVGAAHVVLRPILRIATKPLGCVTLGLSGFAIDVGLIYGCAHFLSGFSVPKLLDAALAALLVNAACLIVGGRH